MDCPDYRQYLSTIDAMQSLNPDIAGDISSWPRLSFRSSRGCCYRKLKRRSGEEELIPPSYSSPRIPAL
jgi:hypothetical protein